MRSDSGGTPAWCGAGRLAWRAWWRQPSSSPPGRASRCCGLSHPPAASLLHAGPPWARSPPPWRRCGAATRREVRRGRGRPRRPECRSHDCCHAARQRGTGVPPGSRRCTRACCLAQCAAWSRPAGPQPHACPSLPIKFCRRHGHWRLQPSARLLGYGGWAWPALAAACWLELATAAAGCCCCCGGGGGGGDGCCPCAAAGGAGTHPPAGLLRTCSPACPPAPNHCPPGGAGGVRGGGGAVRGAGGAPAPHPDCQDGAGWARPRRQSDGHRVRRPTVSAPVSVGCSACGTPRWPTSAGRPAGWLASGEAAASPVRSGASSGCRPLQPVHSRCTLCPLSRTRTRRLADLGFDVDIGPLFMTPREVAQHAVDAGGRGSCGGGGCCC